LGNDKIDQNNYMDYIHVLHDNGVRNVLLSLGGQGAFYSGEAGQLIAIVPDVQVFSTVGAGDSMLASFVGQLDSGNSFREAMLYGAATGTAMVMTEDLPSMELIKEIISKTELIDNI
ncbi:MAG: hypothetical protein IJI05_04295, partial [Erysipelotrichaceae bacterium]|nr:hypothetical protein [Erysipelotrichaceae bacterium]